MSQELKLAERKIAIATSAPWKIEVLSPFLDALVGKNNWGTLEKVVSGFVGGDVSRALVNRLIDEPSHDLSPVLSGVVPVTSNMDALSKVVGGMGTVVNVLPSSASYWKEGESVSVYQVVAIDSMSAFLSEMQVAQIEKVAFEQRRKVIDEMIANHEIKFNNKATEENLEQMIENANRAFGLVVLAVVKGVSLISGVHKYETIVTPIVGKAFLYAGKWKEEDRAEIISAMRKNGFGISSGIKSQDLFEKGLMETVYCGHLHGNGEKLKLALTGIPLDDVEHVVLRNDANIAQELAARAIDVEPGLLLGSGVNSLTDAGFALARLGRYLSKIREDGKVEQKILIRNFSDLQDFVLRFNMERNLSENAFDVVKRLEVEHQEFAREANEYTKGATPKLRLNMGREVADVVIYLAKLANYYGFKIDDLLTKRDDSQTLALEEMTENQKKAINSLVEKVDDTQKAQRLILDLIKNAFSISQVLGLDLFDLVSRKCQRNSDKYDALTLQKLEAAGLEPFFAEAVVKALWDKHLDDFYFS